MTVGPVSYDTYGNVRLSDLELARRLKHVTTTAKVPHRWEYFHDEVGYNYRLPNLNAALGCAQLEQLPNFLIEKRHLFDAYQAKFANIPGVCLVAEPAGCRSNYWLQTLLLDESLAAVAGTDSTAFSETRGAAGGPPHAAHLYTQELLRAAFADMDIVDLREYEDELGEGSGHSGRSALIGMVAIGRHSDRTRERKMHVAACALTAATGLALAGGALSLALAIRAPQRVRRLVLMGSVGVPFAITPVSFSSKLA